MTTQPRQPRGTTRGGQFAPRRYDEALATLDLDDEWWTGATEDGNRVIQHRLRGLLHDTEDGDAAIRAYYPDGGIHIEAHYREGVAEDPDDGTPAYRQYGADGTIEIEAYYREGFLQDPDDGTPALRSYDVNGAVTNEEHYRRGEPTG